MKAVASAMLLALAVQDEDVCDHGTRGASRPVDLRQVARLHAEMTRSFKSLSVRPPATFSFPAFDSGLPACRSRTSRRVRVASLPAEMKPLLFAPEGTRVPPGHVHVTTRARSLKDVSAPADRELVERFGVRCVPTVVRPVRDEEADLIEGETP
jgi:hypothetical protein